MHLPILLYLVASLCHRLSLAQAADADSSVEIQTSGNERRYRFEITRGFVNTDGVNTSTLLTNGQYPGPTLEAFIGDTFVVEVINKITGPESGTSIHWHGLTQKDTKFMDGVPSITQCPVAPGETFTYRFKADRVGTSWWHSHFASQVVGGLFGAMVIKGPEPYHYDIDLGPILINDRYHFDYTEWIEKQAAPALPVAVFTETNHINGRSGIDCRDLVAPPSCDQPPSYSKFNFQSGKKHLLRLIHSGSEALEQFHIDGHKLRIVALDYVPIVPYEDDFVSLSPGQRATVIVEGVGMPQESFWMRADMDTRFPCSLTNQPFAKAIVYYENSDQSKIPTTQPTPFSPAADCGTKPISQTTPLFPPFFTQPAPISNRTFTFTFAPNATGFIRFKSNERPFFANWNNALLADSVSPSYQFSKAPALANIFDFGNDRTTRLVVYNEFPGAHPMHLHGHDFSVVAEGHGEWDGKANTKNPIRRDTHQLLAMANNSTLKSYIVLDVKLDNPGIWPFHCHISGHLALGMMLSIAYDKPAIERLSIPAEVTNICTSWNAYAAANPIDQPDSGLRKFL